MILGTMSMLFMQMVILRSTGMYFTYRSTDSGAALVWFLIASGG